MNREPAEYNVHQAKTHLSRLLSRVAAGEEIVISKAGRPVARLVPIREQIQARTLGQDRDLPFHIADDFDAPLSGELLDAFEGGSDT